MRIDELSVVPEDWTVNRLGKDWKPISGLPVKTRRWAVTVNLGSMPESLQEDVSSADSKRWERCEAWLGKMIPSRRWVASLEEGDKQHSRHLQMAIADDSPVPQKYLLEHLGKAHIEPMHASPAANVAYVSKSETHLAGPWTNGNWDTVLKQRPGKRNDLTDLADRILDLGDDLISEHTIIDDPDVAATALRYPQVVDRLFAERRYRLQQARANQDRTCLWLWGETKAGKSFDVEDLKAKGALGSVYRSTAASNPFDGYVDEHTIWLEEWRGNGVLPQEMLSVTDRWSDVTAGARYHNKPLLHEMVIVTCNEPPDDIYAHVDPMTRDAWLRRWQVFSKHDKNDHPLHKLLGVEEPPMIDLGTENNDDEEDEDFI
jgi:hypothetical protein